MTQTVTETVTSTVTLRPTRDPKPSESSESPTSEPTPTGSPTEAPTLPSDIPLTLDKFFEPNENFEENRYDVAGREDVLGIATEIQRCEQNEYGVLELRLANKYQTLRFSVGQADVSQSSEETLFVEIVGNGTQLEIRRVPFNQIQDFELQVAGVNALKIYLYLDSESPSCRGTSESVIAVLESVVVSN